MCDIESGMSAWSLGCGFCRTCDLHSEQGKLIHQLIESLEDEPYDDPEVVEAEWNVEIVRRVRDIQSGAVEGIPYEEVRRQFGR